MKCTVMHRAKIPRTAISLLYGRSRAPCVVFVISSSSSRASLPSSSSSSALEWQTRDASDFLFAIRTRLHGSANRHRIAHTDIALHSVRKLSCVNALSYERLYVEYMFSLSPLLLLLSARNSGGFPGTPELVFVYYASRLHYSVWL